MVWKVMLRKTEQELQGRLAGTTYEMLNIAKSKDCGSGAVVKHLPIGQVSKFASITEKRMG